MFSLAIFALSLQSPAITFPAQCARLEKLMPGLSQAAGVELVISPRLRDEVLFVSFEKRPLAEAMGLLGEAVSGEWEKAGNGFRLVRSDARERQIHDENLARVKKELQAELDRKKKEIEKEAVFDEAAALKLEADISNYYRRRFGVEESSKTNDQRVKEGRDWDQIQGRAPLEKALEKLSTELDPGVYADLFENKRVVLSSHPTKMQLPLGAAGKSAIETFARMQNVLVGALSKRPTVKREMIMSGDPTWKPEAANVKDLRAVVICETYYNIPDTFVLRLSMFGKGGGLLGNAVTVVGFSGEAPEVKKGGTPFTPSPEFEAVAGLFRRTLIAPEKRPPMPKEWKQRLLNPAQEEPLGYFLAPDLKVIGKALKKDLVANLTDRSARVPGTARYRKAPTVEHYFQLLEGIGQVKSEVRDTAVLIRPIDPIRADRERARRDDLGSFLRSLESLGRESISSLSTFAQNNTAQAYQDLVQYISSMLVSGSNDSMDRVNWDLLRLYGSLSPEQRKTLIGGDPLPFSQLGPQSKFLFADMIFYRLNSIGFEEMHFEDTLRDETQAFGHDVTDAMPTGLLTDSSIALAETIRPILLTFSESADGRQYARQTSIENLVQESLMGQNARSGSPEARLRMGPGFAVGKNRMMVFSFLLRPGVKAGARLKESWFDSRKPVAFDDLSEDIRGQILKALDAERKKREKFGIGTGAGAPPP